MYIIMNAVRSKYGRRQEKQPVPLKNDIFEQERGSFLQEVPGGFFSLPAGQEGLYPVVVSLCARHARLCHIQGSLIFTAKTKKTSECT